MSSPHQISDRRQRELAETTFDRNVVLLTGAGNDALGQPDDSSAHERAESGRHHAPGRPDAHKFKRLKALRAQRVKDE